MTSRTTEGAVLPDRPVRPGHVVPGAMIARGTHSPIEPPPRSIGRAPRSEVEHRHAHYINQNSQAERPVNFSRPWIAR